jgi:fermentation-respiration switch protein FrsA (DUF1100 family)
MSRTALSTRLLSFAAVLSLVVASCADADEAFFSPLPVDEYELTYEDETPPEERVPPELQRLVDFRAEDGTKVYGALVLRPGDESKVAPTVLYHHGNADNIEAYWDRIGLIWSLGANVLVYDYRSFGKTEGKITEKGIYQDARAALAFLRGLGPAIDQARLFHYGYSLGGTAAIELGKSSGPYRGLIVESTFTSADEIAAQAFLVLPASFLVNFEFDNIGKIADATRNASAGTLLFHGAADDYLVPAFSKRLAATIPAELPHELVLIDGAGHDNVPYRRPQSDVYRLELREFLGR